MRTLTMVWSETEMRREREADHIRFVECDRLVDDVDRR